MILKMSLIALLILGLAITLSAAPINHTAYKANTTGYQLSGNRGPSGGQPGDEYQQLGDGRDSYHQNDPIDDVPPTDWDEQGTPDEASPIPEPTTMVLLGLGSLGLGILRKRKVS